MAKKKAADNWYQRLTPEQRRQRLDQQRESRLARKAAADREAVSASLPVPHGGRREPETVHFPINGFVQTLEARAAAEPQAKYDMDFLADLALRMARRA